MGRMKRPVTAAALALLITAACGSASAAPAETRLPVVATLPPLAATLASPTPTPTPSAATSSPAAPSAAPSATGSASSGLLALGKTVYETAGEVGCVACHGPLGKGGRTKEGDTAPDIRGASETKLRDALRGGATQMTYIKLSDGEIEAVVEYLSYLNDLD